MKEDLLIIFCRFFNMFILLIILLTITFSVRKIDSKYFEDNSGRITIEYCLPFGLCK
jgi:hypothetical protein